MTRSQSQFGARVSAQDSFHFVFIIFSSIAKGQIRFAHKASAQRDHRILECDMRHWPTAAKIYGGVRAYHNMDKWGQSAGLVYRATWIYKVN